MTLSIPKVPRAFIWRRLHSLTGLWLVLFLIEHLLTNSQAALLLGENGQGFVRMVNAIHNLPYLEVIEISLLGIPFLIHMYWGVVYLCTSKSNSRSTDGSKPSLPQYGRNRAFTWQRMTSWILLFLIIGHVVKFRFLDYPVTMRESGTSKYLVSVSFDRGLYTVAPKLGVTLYNSQEVEQEVSSLNDRLSKLNNSTYSPQFVQSNHYDPHYRSVAMKALELESDKARLDALNKFHLKPSQVLVIADDFGTASLMSVRNTFKYPIYVGLYTVFVLAVAFHAFNGFWTFLITWGAVFKVKSQRSMVAFCIAMIFVVAFLGLASVWGTYWLNLKS